MAKRILCYWLAVLVTIYCFFIYDDKIIKLLLVMEILYFVISLLGLAALQKRVNASLTSETLIAEKNKEVPITIMIKNTSNISAVHFDVILTMENTFTGEVVKHKTYGTAQRGTENQVTVLLCAKACGKLRVTLEKIEIYDRFFILKKGIKIKETSQIGVLPECHLMPVEISRKTREFIADAEEYSDRESGDDPLEIYQVREYRKEDSIHDIHWKLSAKADKLLVKEHGKPLGSKVLIWLGLENVKKRKKAKSIKRNFGKKFRRNLEQKEMLTKVFELAASISLSLLEENCVHTVAWYEPEDKVIHKKKICKEEHIYELLHRLLYVESYENAKEVEVQYKEAFRGEKFSTIVKLQLDDTITVDEKMLKIPVEKGKIQWNRLYLKV